MSSPSINSQEEQSELSAVNAKKIVAVSHKRKPNRYNSHYQFVQIKHHLLDARFIQRIKYKQKELQESN